MNSIPTISGHGDCGDEISAMPIARALGKASFLLSDHPMCKPITRPDRIGAIKSIMESQDYIDRVDVWRGEKIDYDAAPWRSGGIDYGMNLADLHANFVGVKISTDPWITLEPNKDFEGAIIVNRSTRHRSQYFPWPELIDHYGKDMVFVGLQEEWIQFQNEFGRKVKYQPTKDFKEVGELIQASRLFIGNQSCAVNVCIGLGKKFVMECSLTSVDCIYKRPDSHYCPDGEIVNLKVYGYEPFNSPPAMPERTCDLNISPPGQWFILTSKSGKSHRNMNARKLLREANAYESGMGLPLSTERDLIEQTVLRHPHMNSQSHNNIILQQAANIKRLVYEVNSR